MKDFDFELLAHTVIFGTAVAGVVAAIVDAL